MLFRSWRRKEQPNWQERTGNLPLEGKNAPPRIWFHAVSVGEVIAATPILREIKRLLPAYQIILSVTTSSGHQTAAELKDKPFDTLIYFPIDVARFQLSAMQKVRPKAVVIMETELWMNFLWAAKVFDAKTILVNGRISDRSFPRSQKVAFYYRSLLKNLDLALMQTELDKDRVIALGAQSVMVLGNAKFDQAVSNAAQVMSNWKSKLEIPENAKVIVIGSTRGDYEEEFVLAAIQIIWSLGIWVIHAPRHLEDVADLEARARKRFGEVSLLSSDTHARYQIVDRYGVLAELYSIADVCIIGGGFAKLGGQNIIQPLAHGKPVLHGPYMHNFRDSTELADRQGAAICCLTPEQLGRRLQELFGDDTRRERMASEARALVTSHLGASLRYAEEIRKILAKPSENPKAKR